MCDRAPAELGTLQHYLEVTPEQRRKAVAGKRVLTIEQSDTTGLPECVSVR